MTQENRTQNTKSRIRFVDEDVGKLKAALESGQRTHKSRASSMSMRELIGLLRNDIVELRKRGFTVEVIADMICEGGFDHLAPSTLRRYVSATSFRKRHRKRSTKSKSVGASTRTQQAPLTLAQSSATAELDAGFAVVPDREDL